MVQVPAFNNVMVTPFVPVDVQMVVVELVKVTAKPEVAVPLTVSGVWSIVLLAKAAKVMVCAMAVTVKLCVTAGAAA